ncbi:MAG: SPOR domain-containing protein [Blastocatellia bacterium]
MTNKQVIAIFVAGVALLLGAFWAGLSVIKQDSTSDASTANQNARAGSTNPGSAGATSNTREQGAAEGARYVVFVAAFGTLEKAKQLESDLKRKYLAAHVKTPNGNQETLFRVNIGPYDKQDADKVATELATEGRKGIMVLPWTQN